ARFRRDHATASRAVGAGRFSKINGSFLRKAWRYLPLYRLLRADPRPGRGLAALRAGRFSTVLTEIFLFASS
ncbi:MAG: hypothetical protein J6X44_07055, partial [Thermoguttaceae bacterium]|nr:hypothetical protein [Thermoguttaceae bacterium]